MKNNKKYIQLPPFPEDYDGKTVGIIWEFTKLKKESQIAVHEQLLMMEKIEEHSTEEIDHTVEHIPASEIESYQESLRSMIAEIFREACALARIVYTECFVKGTALESLMKEFPNAAEDILIMYYLFKDGENDTNISS